MKELWIVILYLLFSCNGDKEKAWVTIPGNAEAFVVVPDATVLSDSLSDTPTERWMRGLGLVDIQEVNPLIQVHLVYATADNFVGKVLYADLHKAFMLPETAWRLTEARRRLQRIRPDWTLRVYDAARPMEVQQQMWEQVRGTDKREYVSNPKNGGGLHNYGAAVDVALVEASGNLVPMGSPFDYFGKEARPDLEEEMVKQGKISPEELHNRRLLRRVMMEAGFRALPSEWWHFNLVSREEARRTLRVIKREKQLPINRSSWL